MDVMRAVDVSGWTGDISDAAWQSMKSSGIELAIIQGYGGGPDGFGRNHSAPQQARGAVSAGLRLAGYSWPPGAVMQALDNLKGAGSLLFMALDVEAGAGVGRGHVDALEAAGVHPVIYTSRSKWFEIMSNSPGYTDVDLWEAIYPRGRTAADWPTSLDTGLVPPPGLPRRVGWQWRGTTPLFGESVDLSVFDRAWVLGLAAQQQEGEDMERLIRVEGQLDVWVRVGMHLESAISPELLAAAGYDISKVDDLPQSHPIWTLPRTLAGAVPLSASEPP